MPEVKLSIALFSAVLALASGAAHAQAWPAQKPITLIAPAAAGGGLDTLARALANRLGKDLGQNIIVENKPGASGILGLQTAARSPADGYTFVMGWPASIVSTQFLFDDLPFDAKADFDPVSLLVGIDVVLVASAQTPAGTVQELVDWAQRNKGKVSYGSYAVGGYGHIALEYLNKTRELGAQHVPYKSEMPTLMGTAGNEVAFSATAYPSVAQFKETGKIKVLAVFSPQRMENLPDVPTFAEAGFPDPVFATSAWYGIFAPKGVPTDISEKMTRAVQAAMNSPELQQVIKTMNMRTVASDAQTLRDAWYSDIPVYEKLVEMSGARTQQ